MPLFDDKDGISEYSLVVGFPDRKNYLRSSISYLIILSVLFILVIILSFYFTVLNSIKQKNISEMKTDFINNMTHEFKTPISTISLSAEVLKGSDIINQPDRLHSYATIIENENLRLKNFQSLSF